LDDYNPTKEQFMKSSPFRFSFLSALFFPVLLVVGCGSIEMNSFWRDREITVDGKDADWLGVSVYSTEEPEIAVGLVNDESNLYILLRTHDRSLLPQMVRGFTVWFDPYGKKNKTFGVHFPIGGREMGSPPGSGGKGPMEGGKMGSSEELPEELSKLPEESLHQVELIGPDKDERSTLAVADAEARGVKVKMALSNGQLTYELQVSLKQDAQHPYAIAIPRVGVNTSQKISIGLETDKFEMPKEEGSKMGFPGGGEGRMPPGGGMGPGGGGGMGPGGGGMGPGGGGMGPPGGFRMPKRLNLWATLKLASKK
jgi:hypothetical protein